MYARQRFDILFSRYVPILGHTGYLYGEYSAQRRLYQSSSRASTRNILKNSLKKQLAKRDDAQSQYERVAGRHRAISAIFRRHAEEEK